MKPFDYMPNNLFVGSMFAAVALVGLSAAFGQAQEISKTNNGPTGAARGPRPTTNGPATTTPSAFVQKHDLAISHFSGTMQGQYFVLSVKVKNVGQSPFPGERHVQVLNYKKDKKGNFMVWRERIPALQPGQEHTVPLFRLHGPAMSTNHFIAMIKAAPKHNRDINIANDWREIQVDDPVR